MLAFSQMLPARLATEADVWHSRRIKTLTSFLVTCLWVESFLTDVYVKWEIYRLDMTNFERDSNKFLFGFAVKT